MNLYEHKAICHGKLTCRYNTTQLKKRSGQDHTVTRITWDMRVRRSLRITSPLHHPVYLNTSSVRTEVFITVLRHIIPAHSLSCSTGGVLLQNATVAQLVKKLPGFRRRRVSIAVFTTAVHWSVSSTRERQRK